VHKGPAQDVGGDSTTHAPHATIATTLTTTADIGLRRSVAARPSPISAAMTPR
jgi:hypothetical protein